MAAASDMRVTVQITDSRTYASLHCQRQGRWTLEQSKSYAVEPVIFPRHALDLQPIARTLADRLPNDFPLDRPVACIVPANWCLIEAVNLPAGRSNDAAALYEFEQRIPLDLESLSCLVVTGDRGTAVVAGMVTGALRTFLDILQEHSVFVDPLAIDAIVANRVLGGNSPDTAGGFVLADCRHCTLFSFSADRTSSDFVITLPMSGATSSPAVPYATPFTLPALQDSTQPWHLVQYHNEDGAGLSRHASGWGQLDVSPLATTDFVNRVSEYVVELPDHLNLRQGPLRFAGRWNALRSAVLGGAASLALLLLVLGVRWHLNADRYMQASRQLEIHKSALFQRAFPGQANSPAAALRVRSERIKLEGMTHRQDSTMGRTYHVGLSVLKRLSDVLERIPNELKLDIVEAAADERTMRFVGRTTSHTSAGSLVGAFNTVAGLAFEPPATALKKDGTVEFRIHGSIVDEDSAQ